MKKTLKTAGAFGLAAATIVTGLSFGTTAAVAASTDAPSTEVLRTFTSPIGWALADGKFVGVNHQVNVGFATAFSSQEKLLSDSNKIKVTQYTDGTFTMEDQEATWNSPGDRVHCSLWDVRGPALQDSGIQGAWRACTGSDTAITERWIPNPDGTISPLANPTRTIGAFPGGWMRAATQGATLIGDDVVRSLFFGASVTSRDLHARTAVLTGTAAPLAKVIINGNVEVEADAQGNWSTTVTGLTLGSNTISLSQWENGAQTAETTVEVDLAVKPVVADTTFLPAPTQEAVASGTAEPGATIVISDATGTEIARTIASTISNGAWTTSVPAPNTGGDYPVTIHQEIDGEINGGITNTIAYGAAVTVTTPVDDMAHDGGRVTMSGTGEPGAEIMVREQGSSTVIGSTTVIANSTWNLITTNVDTRKHVLETTQTGKGNNVTTSTVTLNPEAVTPVTPVTVTSPVSGTEFTPNTSVRFTGTGEAGGIIVVTPTNGAAPVTTQVRADGSWSVDRYLGNGPYTFDVTQVAGGVTSSVAGIALTPKQTAPIDKAFVISTPTTGSTVKNQLAPFTGTGAAGTTVRIHTTNFASADITTIVGNDGAWWVNKWIGDGPYVMDITQEGRVAGEVRGFTLNNDVAVNLPFAVTTPTAGDDIRSKVQTFTGTGRHGELVTLKATSPSGLAEVSGVVKRDGTWSINRYIGDGPYAFDVIQTKNGVETGAERDFRINQPAKRDGVTGPLVVTGPTDGTTFTVNTQAAFTGTGTTGAIITVTPTAGAAVTTEVAEDGTWSVNKYLGDGPYTFTVTSTLEGVVETNPGTISLTPAP
jgi:hypothetical protein